ncbi:hypothetical protein AV530_014911 [Patagioenas fasciata monilis]|uniref:Uncharacterized protein n=1 Tax=Patagioenas fasciata monilis TaxID=372326 RepID=A0A1V4K0A6_PATFA|nr:hypothetical protein AV530_014911 [Patagioenas fasciata monilis]
MCQDNAREGETSRLTWKLMLQFIYSGPLPPRARKPTQSSFKGTNEGGTQAPGAQALSCPAFRQKIYMRNGQEPL